MKIPSRRDIANWNRDGEQADSLYLSDSDSCSSDTASSLFESSDDESLDGRPDGCGVSERVERMDAVFLVFRFLAVLIYLFNLDLFITGASSEIY